MDKLSKNGSLNVTSESFSDFCLVVSSISFISCGLKIVFHAQDDLLCCGKPFILNIPRLYPVCACFQFLIIFLSLASNYRQGISSDFKAKKNPAASHCSLLCGTPRSPI